jgi:alpha-beta hydrolase superfamily lysophospholipase
MTQPPLPKELYLHHAGDPVYAVYHAPVPGHVRDTAVVLCPPFGWDEVSSYRSRREWGQHLAQAGYPTLRLSLPSTGDSGGAPRDPERLPAWTTAVRLAAESLLATSPIRRVTAVAMGLGAAIAYHAAATGAPIDDLVLWAVPTRGRDFVRQLRAFSRLEASQFFDGLDVPAPLADGELEAGGFLLSAQTRQELDGLDLAALPLPDSRSRRVLLLERDGISVDERLREALGESGVDVTVSKGDGYGAMTSHPQGARPALEVFERVGAWLDAGSTPVPAAAPLVLSSHASRSASIRGGNEVVIRETILNIEQPFGRLSGVLSERESSGERSRGLCAVLLNAGAVRRIGPSRLWVEAARRWAALGVPTLRLDLEGLGEADGDATPYAVGGDGFYVPTLVPQVLATIEFLHARGTGERFLLAGLCSGGYWAFQAARRDKRVHASVLINPGALVWNAGLAPARDFRAATSGRLTLAKVRREASAARLRALARWLLGAPRRRVAQLLSPDRGTARGAEVVSVLREWLATGQRGTFVFSEREAMYDELVSSGAMALLEQSPNVTLERIAVHDHTLRPNWAQQQAHQALDRALQRELASDAVAPAPRVEADVSAQSAA